VARWRRIAGCGAIADEQNNAGDKEELHHGQGSEWTGTLPLGAALRWVDLDAGNRSIMLPSPPVARGRLRQFSVEALASDCCCRNTGTLLDQRH